MTKSSNPEFVGRTFIVTVQDNNGAGEDRYGFVITATTFSGALCLVVASTDPIVKGNIEVVESTFPP